MTALTPDAVQERLTNGPIPLSGTHNGLYERHLAFDNVIPVDRATARDRFEAAARSLRDLLSQRWVATELAYEKKNAKRVYYLSMEFLIGRTFANNMVNLLVEPACRDLAQQKCLDLMKLIEQEPDAGLGNGGLGRLAACFLDSMATLGIPGMGYGLRYEFGIFKQSISNGWQTEQPDHWLRRPDPWEVSRPEEAGKSPLGCSFDVRGGALAIVRGKPSTMIGIPHDRPTVGYGATTINTLRLWSAHAQEDFDFAEFGRGDFVGSFAETLSAETLTRVLYPDDSTEQGKGLRFLQEYFLVACSLADLVRRFRRTGNDWSALPSKAAIQMNDTHPAMAVAELMRLLLDEAKLEWDQAWDITRRTLAYTNHTLLPEALEKWPVAWFEALVPRLLEIIYEINRRHIEKVRAHFPWDEGRVSRMSLIEEGGGRKVRMASLAIVGSHSINGVAALHTELLKKHVVHDFAEMMPERFNNKTNGVTQRRFLLMANPPLARLITDAIGEGWITKLDELERLKPLAEDASFRDGFLRAKHSAKTSFVSWLTSDGGGSVDPQSIFDSQIKRIHEYKRQLLNALHIVVLYHRLLENTNRDMPSRTFFLAGKAAPAYHFAKLVIKFVNNLAITLDGDPAVRGRLKVVFVPDYRVTVAEHLIPASDVSEQISTAGYEASGTSNMKFMMNGALTIGTRDGATIEMAEAAGEDNFFLFGLTADQVASSRPWYSPHWHYNNEPETRAVLDMIRNNHFSRNEPGIFNPLLEVLLDRGDFYMHLADLTAYTQAQERLGALYRDPQAWAKKAILNIASSGRFSSDRTIQEYASQIWHADPCPVD